MLAGVPRLLPLAARPGSAATKPDLCGEVPHVACSAGRKKFEPPRDLLIHARAMGQALPLLERVLGGRTPTLSTDVS